MTKHGWWVLSLSGELTAPRVHPKACGKGARKCRESSRSISPHARNWLWARYQLGKGPRRSQKRAAAATIQRAKGMVHMGGEHPCVWDPQLAPHRDATPLHVERSWQNLAGCQPEKGLQGNSWDRASAGDFAASH